MAMPDDDPKFQEWVAAVRKKLTTAHEAPPETAFMTFMRDHWTTHKDWKAGMEPLYVSRKWLATVHGEDEKLYP